jgi:hypothetical protein
MCAAAQQGGDSYPGRKRFADSNAVAQREDPSKAAFATITTKFYKQY